MKTLNIKNICMMSIFTALIAIGAFIKIPIPFLPITLQILFTMLAGLLLGPRLGAISVGAYIALGLLGIPVFTGGGGFGYVLKPSFGFIIGFAVGAYVTGKIANKSSEPSFKRIIAANLAGIGVIYFIGMVYFYLITNLYIGEALDIWTFILNCFLVPLPGDLLKCLLAAILAKRLIPLLRKRGFSNK